MKRFDLKHLLHFPGKLFDTVKKFLFLPEDDEENSLVIDTSHMQKKALENKCHFLFVILFGLSVASALWQHGSPLFTLGILVLLLPIAFFVYIPARFTNGLLQQMAACLIFFGSCFWMVFRIQKGIALDMVFIEGLALCAFSFFIKCTARDYAYIYLVSMLLVVYGGLIPRKLLLYLIPGAAGCLLLSFAVERIRAFAGTRKLIHAGTGSRWRNFGRTWHFYLLQILLFIPLFLLIFSLIPLGETGDEGLFEVSFATSRTSVMPPDLKKWLLQDRKVIKGKYAQYLIESDEPDTAGTEGKKTVPSNLPGKEDKGRGSGAPPGKDLLFTAVMPVKLYHLATLYDVYDGKKWITSPAFAQSKIYSGRRFGTNRPYYIDSRYTMRKWISPNLYTPFRATDVSTFFNMNLIADQKWSHLKYIIRHSNAKIILESKTDEKYPPLPYSYTVRSLLLLPVVPRPPGPKPAVASPKITAPVIYTSAEEYFARITEKENIRREKARIAAEKARIAAEKRAKAAEARRAAARKAAEARRAAAARKAAQRRAAAAKRNKNVKQIQKPVAKKPVAKKPVAKKSVAKKPVAKKPVAKKPVAKKSVAKKPVAKKPVAKKPVARKPVVRRRIIRDPVWHLSLPAAHFLQLPKNLSPRIAELAKDITKNVHTPYEKAVALRDYLRNNYKYKLYASPVPADKESVEYFLFELKEGHCEYFAAALTVLARSAGLPARVATGFSPGNYNALTRQIEVYEYHAHAWSQIFIANTGWLTFDAVPPSDIVSETTPLGIGRFRDPFGDEWRVTPPELTKHTLQYVQTKLQEEAALREAERLKREADQKEQKKVSKLETAKKAVPKKDLKKAPQKVRQVKPTGLKERFKNFVNKCKGKIKEKFFVVITAPEARIAAIIIILVAAIILCFFHRTVELLKHLFYRRRSKVLMERARLLQSEDPALSVLYFYRALRLLLILARMERKKNMELLAYASEIRKTYSALLREKQLADPSPDNEDVLLEKSRKLERDLRLVFNLFYSLEYGNCPCTAVDAAKCEKAVSGIHAVLKELRPNSLLP